MSSRYQKAFSIPDGFPQVLKSFTREVRSRFPARRLPWSASRVLRRVAPSPRPRARASNSRPDSAPPRSDRSTRRLTDALCPTLAPPRLSQILRAQPENIYEFGATYFAEKIEENARERDRRERAARGEFDAPAGGDEAYDDVAPRAGMFDMTDEEMQDFIMDQFMRYDADQDGYLDRHEFKELLMDAELGLSKKDARRVMQEADENDDGVLEYREFVPVMVEIIHGLKAKAEAQAQAEDEEDEAREAVEMHLLHGMPREDLEAIMRAVFESADVDGSGALDRKEFSRCLKSAELGLTRKEINLLLCEVDENGDGLISYEEFVPLCFNILVERFKEDVLAEAALQNADALTQLLRDEFDAAKATATQAVWTEAGEGHLPFRAVKKVLKRLSDDMLGLSRLQISAIMAESKPDEEEEERPVNYGAFAPVAARMIYSMVDSTSQAMRLDAVAKISEADGAHILNQLDGDTIKEVISQAFEEADADGNGVLDREEVYTVLRALGASELALSTAEINAMIAAVDDDGDGVVSYGELVDFLFDVLTHLERENYIQDVAFATYVDRVDELDAMMEEREAAEEQNEE